MTTTRFLLVTALSATLLSCGPQSKNESASATGKTAAKVEKKASETDPDVFFYTVEKRHDKYVPTEEKMSFSKKIESVNTAEFQGNQSLKEVWIGPQIKHIANNAFTGCSHLEAVHFAGDMPVINDEAFMNCTALKSLQVDAWTIGLDAFNGCTSLQSARFGEHIYWIRSGAFAGCTNLRTVLMAITMEKLEDNAFDGCGKVQEFSIPNDFKNRMFDMFPNQAGFRKIYLLSTEYYPMPKNCQPSKQCTLYVPDAFLAQFQQDAQWQQFGSIQPLSKSTYYTAEGFWKK